MLQHYNGDVAKQSHSPAGRLVLPPALRTEALQNAHDHPLSGHVGFSSTYERITRRYWWQNVYSDTRHWVNSCVLCQSRNASRNHHRDPRNTLPPLDALWERVIVDVVGPITKTEIGNAYIVVFIDALTKYAEAFPVQSQDGQTIARLYAENIVCRHGVARYFLSDRGHEFMNVMVRELFALLGTIKLYSAAYYPKYNGQVERLNSPLKAMLSKFVSPDHKDWDRWVPYITFAYNTSTHASTKHTPFFLMYGRDPVLPADVSLLRPETFNSINEYVARILERQQGALEFARSHLGHSKQMMLLRHERSPNVRPMAFVPGDRVWRYVPTTLRGRPRVFLHRYFGPYRVLEKLENGLTYRIQLTPRHQIETVPGNALKIYYPRD